MQTLKNYLLEMVEENEETVYDTVISFFINNPNPSDDAIHNLAKRIGINHDELEERIYLLLSDLLKDIGKNNHIPDKEFNQNELMMGIQIELEHTDNKLIAKMIAKDHLMELPDYYTRLREMESQD